jgi:hypothetical protein
MTRQIKQIPNQETSEDEMSAVVVVDDIQELINNAGGPAPAKLVTRVYRRLRTAANGRTVNEFCGKFYKVVDEQDVGENFGPGEYMIHFRWWDKDGIRQETTRNYNIGNEFEKPVKTEEGSAGAPVGSSPVAPAQTPGLGGLLGGLLGNITAEKVTAGLALLEAFKKFVAPPPPPDYTKLFELMVANQRGQTVGDAVVIEALKQANKPAAPVPTVMDQINNLKAVRDAFKNDFADNNNNDQGGDKMDTLIEIGLKYLPDLLAKHNNNYKAAGAEAAQHNFVKGLIASDPELTQKFFQAAVDNYGQEAAAQLAQGFGIPLTFNDKPAQGDAQAATNEGV